MNGNGKILLLLSVLTHLVGSSFSQTSVEDSLLNEYSKASGNYQKAIILNELFSNQFNSDSKKATEYADRSMQLALELDTLDIKNQQLLGTCANNLGVLSMQNGKYDKALDKYLYALKIAESTHDSVALSKTYNNIGVLYGYQGDLENALHYISLSGKIDEQMKNYEGAIATYMNVAAIYVSVEQFELAEEYSLKTITIVKELGDDHQLATLYLNYGSLKKEQDSLPQGLDYYHKAIQIYETNNYQVDLVASYYNVSVLYYLLGDYSSALDYGNQSLELALELNAAEDIKNAYHSLAKTHARLGNIEESTSSIELYSNWNDSVYSRESAAQIAEMQTKYDTEKKEQENQLLKKDNDIQQLELDKQNASLERSRLMVWFASIGVVFLLVLAFLLLKQNRIKQVANENLKEANDIISEKNKDITDSIQYASRIQNAVLPSDELRNQLFPESFVLFKPKDIVSGDFYWYGEKNGKKIIAVVDCTGHGVPGAFMSMIGNSLLNEIIFENGVLSSDEILMRLREKVIEALDQRGVLGESRDGMDISLCVFDQNCTKVEFSGAYNGLYLLRNGEFEEYKADRQPIGYYEAATNRFTKHEIQLKENDQLYFFSDGYIDQFGGSKGKKYKLKRLLSFIQSIQGHPMAAKNQLLDQEFIRWKGDYEQLDDVCLVGIKI